MFIEIINVSKLTIHFFKHVYIDFV